MYSRNYRQVIGNLGGDPEIQETTNGGKRAKLQVATTHSYKKDGEWQNNTTWHNILVFGPAADDIKVRKGDLVHCEGSHEVFKFNDKETDEPRTYEYLKTFSVQRILDRSSEDSDYQAAKQAKATTAMPPRKVQPAADANVEVGDDEDLPF